MAKKIKKLFGTDGIRGFANKEPITPEMCLAVGKAVAFAFRRQKEEKPKILIGKDTRLSGYMIESALTSGITSMGVDVIVTGPIPTPAVAYLTRELNADAGIMISASHNPPQDNGIKIFSSKGFKLPDSMELEIEKLIFSGKLIPANCSAEEMGKAYRLDDALERYLKFVMSTIPSSLDFSGFKAVVDCANGAAYKVAPLLLKNLGIKGTILANKPDGYNINVQCGSLYPETLQMIVREKKADFGFAFDGDADRVIFVDERGEVVNGDQLMVMCSLDMAKEGKLCKNTLVTTTMSNMGLEVALRNAGISTIRTDVGDRYVLEKMLSIGANFGGEQSGHLIFLDHNTTGDGLITALQVIYLLKKTGKSLSELASYMPKFPQVLKTVEVKKKVPLQKVPGLMDRIKEIEEILGNEGRVLVRYSGTQMAVRVMIEGKDFNLISQLTDSLTDIFAQNI